MSKISTKLETSVLSDLNSLSLGWLWITLGSSLVLTWSLNQLQIKLGFGLINPIQFLRIWTAFQVLHLRSCTPDGPSGKLAETTEIVFKIKEYLSTQSLRSLQN